MIDQPTRSLSPHAKLPADLAAAAATPGVNEATTAPDGPTIANSAELLPPTAVGRYHFLEEIARGGMGVVFRATDSVLDREVAVKVLSDRFEPESAAARRFLDEARIAGQLQHPGIPAIHDLGALPDGRPFLAMKLVKGNTLDALLADRKTATAERGRFVAVFEQICQAIGYAHAHQVIHRDLKPANVMVGAFGEVQVMDWGLAKVLTSREQKRPATEPEETAAGTRIHSLRDSDGSETQAGSILGTPAFMPPEQALGAVDQIDARSDVFGLGAILVVILTGQPPFVGDTAESTRQAAAKGKVGDAFTRLDACGAEPELVQLCKRCLAAEKDDRPADGGAVATAVAELRAAADERARQAELDRVRAEGERIRAEAEAREQHKRRKLQLKVAVMFGLLLAALCAFGWWRIEVGREEHERHGRNAEAVKGLLDQCEAALRDNDAAKAALALQAAQKRVEEGGADDLAERLGHCEQDLAVLRDLDEIDKFGWTAVESKYPDPASVAARYREALGRFGADPDRAGAEEATARVLASSVRERLVAALDRLVWAGKTAGVRAALRAADPDSFRDAARDAVQARDWAALAELAGRPDALVQPTGFATFLAECGTIQVQRQRELLGAERRRELLGAALRRRPGDLGVLMALGNTYPLNEKEGAEAGVRWYQAAVAVAPTNTAAYNNLGAALLGKKDLEGAVAAYREAIRLDPMYVPAHSNLGNVLRDKKDLVGAIAACREAIRLDPEFSNAHSNLGNALYDQKDLEGAIAAYREAIRLDPMHAVAQNNLGTVLRDKKDLEGAIAAYQAAIRLAPKYARAHAGLGDALYDKKDLEGAVAAYREAIRLDPNYAVAHANLGWTLARQGDLEGAIAAYREAIRLDPKNAFARANLPLVERMHELLPRLPDILAGRAEPKTPAEGCEFAYLCAQPFSNRFNASAQRYDAVFTTDPKLADDFVAGHRYNAACYAARAARGDGVDAPTDARERAGLQAKALSWLRADLALRRKQAASSNAVDRKTAADALAQWFVDTDLSGLRPGLGRIGMAEAERADWDKFWAEVRATRDEALKPPPQEVKDK